MEDNYRSNTGDDKKIINSERTPIIKSRKQTDLTSCNLNDKSHENSFTSRRTPLNLNFLKTKYNPFGETIESNSYLDSYRTFSKQLKSKFDVDRDEEEEGMNQNDYEKGNIILKKEYLETDIDNLKYKDNKCETNIEYKEILKTIETIKGKFHHDSNYSYKSTKPLNNNIQNLKNITPKRTQIAFDKHRDKSNHKTLEDKGGKDDNIENIERIRKYVNNNEKRLNEMKNFFKLKIKFLTNLISEFGLKEKKLKEEINHIQIKYNVLLQEYQSNYELIQQKTIKTDSNVINDEINSHDVKKFIPKFDSYIKLLREIGLESSLIYKENNGNLDSNIILDTCDCKNYLDHKCGNTGTVRWNYHLFLANCKLRTFLEILGKRINYDNTYRSILQENYSKSIKEIGNDNSTNKLKIVRRLPKLSNNTSIVSSIKSGVGKETNDLKDDSLLKEIQC